MKTKTGLSCMLALLLAVTVIGVGAEEQTVEATAGWVAEGRLFQVQDKQALFVGTFEGLIFVKTQQGKLDGAKMLCPGLIEIDLERGTESGAGRCIFTSKEAETVYAKWTCAGELLQGCRGDFVLLSGTGRFANITGSGGFEFRSDLAELTPQMTSPSVEVLARGLAVWPALTYKIP